MRKKLIYKKAKEKLALGLTHAKVLKELKEETGEDDVKIAKVISLIPDTIISRKYAICRRMMICFLGLLLIIQFYNFSNVFSVFDGLYVLVPLFIIIGTIFVIVSVASGVPGCYSLATSVILFHTVSALQSILEYPEIGFFAFMLCLSFALLGFYLHRKARMFYRVESYRGKSRIVFEYV